MVTEVEAVLVVPGRSSGTGRRARRVSAASRAALVEK
jgi:hypothetical protein